MKQFITAVLVMSACLGLMSQAVGQVVPVSVQDEESWAFEPTLTVKVYDKYISSDLAAGFYDDSVIQSDVYIPLPYGFGFDIWHSSGFNSDLSGGYDDEIDYILTWDGSIGPIGITLGAEYWDLFDPVGEFGNEDAWGYRARISAPTIEMDVGELADSIRAAPYIEGKLYQVQSDSGMSGGSVVYIGVQGEAIDPYGFPCTASIDYALGHDDGAFGMSPAEIFRFKYSLTWNWDGPASIVFPDVALSVPFNNDDEREAEVAFGGGITYDF